MVLAVVKIAFLAGLALTGDGPGKGNVPRVAAVNAPSSAVPPLQDSAALPDPVRPTVPAENPVSQAPALAAAPVSVVPAALPSDEAAVVPPRACAASADGDPLQAALAQASSRSALSVPRLLGASVAHAADLPPVPQVAAPAPKVKPMISPVAPERVLRPDEITPLNPPAPTVGPYVSPDSAARKQAELNRREQELLGLQQQMESRMKELHGLENRLQGMLQDADNAQNSKFRQLVDMYANMKPRQAARALTSMDESIAVKILTGMKSKQSGEILSYMDPAHAARLSEVMSKMQM